jgi:cell division septation protein DedD
MDANQAEKNTERVARVETGAGVEEARPTVARAQPVLLPSPHDDNLPADAYAVGVRILKIAPAWLLAISVCFALLLLLLSWMRPEVNASGASSAVPNDSKTPAAASQTVLTAPVVLTATDRAKNAEPGGEVAPAVGSGGVSAPVSAPVSDARESAETAPSPASTPADAQSARPSDTEESDASAARKDAREERTDAAPASVQNATTASVQTFTVQAGSHSDESEANEQVSKLRAAGFDARAVAVELPGRGRWYRVQAGRFNDRAEASKMAGQMRARGVTSGAIVVPAQD